MNFSLKPNPLFLKDLRINSRSKKTMLLYTLVNAFMAIIIMYIYSEINGEAIYTGAINIENQVALYAAIFCMQVCMYALAMGVIAGSSITSEREKQTLEMLLTTKMTPFGIVFGKLLSSLTDIFMLVITSFPVVFITLMYGVVTVKQILMGVLVIFLVAIYIGSIGIFCSTICNKSSAAIVFSYLFIAAFAFIPVVLFYLIISDSISDIMVSTVANNKVPTINMNNYIILLVLLLVSPFVIGMEVVFKLFEQDSFIKELTSLSRDINVVVEGPSKFIIENIFVLSVVVQIGISILVLFAASKKLNKVKKVKKSKKSVSGE